MNPVARQGRGCKLSKAKPAVAGRSYPGSRSETAPALDRGYKPLLRAGVRLLDLRPGFQLADPVAEHGRPLEIQLLGRLQHLFL